MPTEKRPLKVFLSHAHSNAAAVRALYERLTADGVDQTPGSIRKSYLPRVPAPKTLVGQD